MSNAGTDPDTTELLRELTTALQDLEREVEPERRLRPPTPGELSRFTSEVAIPGLVLLLRTNIRALQLLQRTLRLAGGRSTGTDGSVDRAQDRAEQLGRATLSRLDTVLADLQSALADRPEDDDARDLLTQAERLREQLDETLDGDGRPSGDEVDIDVDAELRSLKDELDDGDDDADNE